MDMEYLHKANGQPGVNQIPTNSAPYNYQTVPIGQPTYAPSSHVSDFSDQTNGPNPQFYLPLSNPVFDNTVSYGKLPFSPVGIDPHNQQLPFSPLVTTTQQKAVGIPNGQQLVDAACIPQIPETNAGISLSADSNMKYILEQQQLLRNIQLQQQQLQRQQQIIQEQLSRLPQTPPITTTTASPGLNSWQAQQYIQASLNQTNQLQNYPPIPPQTLNISTNGQTTLNENHLQNYQPQNALMKGSVDQKAFTSSPTREPDNTDAPKIAAAPPHTYIPNPIDPRQNTLPSSLPTRLNPSLRVKPSFGPGATIADEQTNFSYTNSFIATGLPHQNSWEGPKFDPNQDDLNTSGVGSSVTSSLSPTGSSPTSPNLGRPGDYTVPLYERPPSKDACMRCHQKVYAMEQIGPIKGVLYHKTCFTCIVCGSRLNLKNFHHNPNDMDDLNVYCSSHRPRERAGACDAKAVSIKTALTVPRLEKVNEQIRSDQYSPRLGFERKPSIVACGPIKEQYYYGMGTEKQDTQAPSSENQRQAMRAQEQILQEQQVMLQQQQQQILLQLQQHQQHQEDAERVIESNQKSSVVSTGSQTGSGTEITSTANFAANGVLQGQELQEGQVSSPAASSPETPLSSASNSLSFATGRQNAELVRQISDSTDSALAGETGDKLSLNGSDTSAKKVIGEACASSPIEMRRSDRPSSLGDQSDRASIGSITSSASIDVTEPRKTSTSSLERTDRPSSRSSSTSSTQCQLSAQKQHPRQPFYQRQSSGISIASGESSGCENVAPAAPPEGMKIPPVLVKSRSDMDFTLQKQEKDKNIRYLARNESMRMDRPSQYS